jgi:hypothetical protein
MSTFREDIAAVVAAFLSYPLSVAITVGKGRISESSGGGGATGQPIHKSSCGIVVCLWVDW